ncbi:hypothetical protein [Tateyamaria sp. ANG-S1]|uniref:hypothetical protein n=1 Tax=Tateyamaria sp. ANG-S1 TaxID=1577905 RepID=UPI00057F522A|nr:hypothetical protein [Tateyamaria sp. ANG-S1]KIC48391.1 hypothetical protein RA29_11480 [Tateyamaria sp. ANG-S1]
METHELRLKIDAAAAQSGSRQFVAAVNAVKAAVRDLERDTNGAFTQLQNIKPQVDVSGLRSATTETNNVAKAATATERAAANMARQIQQTALSSAAALRTSEQAAQRLSQRMLDIGDTQGVVRLNGALSQLRSNLTAATSTLDVRSARSQFDDLRSSLLQNTVAAERLRGQQA